jgi:hypothetical protein
MSNTKKIAAVCMVRNESDIIELFLKINSRSFDEFFILDHLSSDTTPVIINELQKTGLKINYIKLTDGAYIQSEYTTAAVRKIAMLNQFDYIFPIDADEFVSFDNSNSLYEIIANSIDVNEAAAVPWVTYCPISADYFNRRAPLYENFRKRRVEPEQYHKVILGNEYAKTCTISQGNHSASNGNIPACGRNGHTKILPIELNHVPVRSAEQIIRKAIVGSYAVALKKNRAPRESFHWDLLAREVREKNYQLNCDDLLEIAMQYSVSPEYMMSDNTLVDIGRIGLEDDVLEHPDLARIDLLKTFDSFISEVVHRTHKS